MGQVPRQHVYGNFKPPKHKRRAPKSDARMKRPGMDENHLALIRKLPCCVCLQTPGGEAHHLKQDIGERGMGLRSTDQWTVPICRKHHDEIERMGSRNETRWFQVAGIESIQELAAALWNVSGDASRMIKVLMTHRSSAAG